MSLVTISIRSRVVDETTNRMEVGGGEGGLKRGTRSVREDSRAMGIQCLPAEKLN